MPKIRDLGIKVIPETMRPPEVGGGGCSDCTTQQFSICGTTPHRCTDCTTAPFSICGTTYVGCTDCTTQAFSICGTTAQQAQAQARQAMCTDCTFHSFSLCGGTVGCTAPFSFCHYPTLGGGCTDCTTQAFSICGTTGRQPAAQISRDQISALKESLRQQIAALEEHEKSLGPKTTAEIDAREKQLNDELAQLKERRKSLK